MLLFDIRQWPLGKRHFQNNTIKPCLRLFSYCMLVEIENQSLFLIFSFKRPADIPLHKDTTDFVLLHAWKSVAAFQLIRFVFQLFTQVPSFSFCPRLSFLTGTQSGSVSDIFLHSSNKRSVYFE